MCIFVMRKLYPNFGYIHKDNEIYRSIVFLSWKGLFNGRKPGVLKQSATQVVPDS